MKKVHVCKDRFESGSGKAISNVILSFGFREQGHCVLTTTWDFPINCPTELLVVFTARAFDVPGGKTVLEDLLYALENEPRDWSKRRIEVGEQVGFGDYRASESSILFSISVPSSHSLHLANGLFVEAATALVKLWGGPGFSCASLSSGGTGPTMPYSAYGGLGEARDYRELLEEISMGLTDCEWRTITRLVSGMTISEIGVEDGVSRAAVRSRVLSAMKRSEYWKISSEWGVLKKRINQHA